MAKVYIQMARRRIVVLGIYVCMYRRSYRTYVHCHRCKSVPVVFQGCSQQFKRFPFDPVASFLPRSSCWESRSLFQASQSPSLTISALLSASVHPSGYSVPFLSSVQKFRLCEAKGPLLSPSICQRKNTKPAK